jgi:hypothetical protein
VAEGRVHGPALTVGDKDYQVGDRVICLANERSGAVSNGTRGVVTAVDVERQTLTLERPDKRQLTLDTTHYDAIDRGYALTVHKAQGMTAGIALVAGSDGGDARVGVHRDVAGHSGHPLLRGVHAARAGHPRRRALERREPIGGGADRAAWSRRELKEAALDYPERYQTPERISAESSLHAPATDGQRALVEMLGGPELAQEATWVEAGEEINRLVAERAYSQVEGWLREMGMSEDAAHEMVVRAVDRIDAEDATGGPHNHLEGRTAASALTPEIDAQLEAAQLEFEREQGLSPGRGE